MFTDQAHRYICSVLSTSTLSRILHQLEPPSTSLEPISNHSSGRKILTLFPSERVVYRRLSHEVRILIVLILFDRVLPEIIL